MVRRFRSDTVTEKQPNLSCNRLGTVTVGHPRDTNEIFSNRDRQNQRRRQSRPRGCNSGDVNCEIRVGRAQASSCVGGDGTVSVLLGHGDGTFGPATDFPVGDGTGPAAMVVGNFNADAKPDLALADSMQYASSVSILLGKGDGAFGNAKGFPVGFWEPDSIAVGDINQDSRDDLAVTSSRSGESVSVLLGRGNGTFGPATVLPSNAGLGASPTAIAIGNLNAGLNPDLAVAIASSHKNRVAVRLNAGPSAR